MKIGGNAVQLYIKQKVFSWRDKFAIKDINGNDRYFVVGEIAWGHKLHIYNINNQEIAFINEKFGFLKSRYEIYLGGILAAELIQDFAVFREKYSLQGINWVINGDFWAHNYSIANPMGVIASITREMFTWGDSYQLNIAEGINDLLVVATVLAIDCEQASRAAAQSSHNN